MKSLKASPIIIATLDVNNLTEIARRITPKNFRKINIMLLPKNDSILLINRKTKKTTIRFRTRARMIFSILYSARNESRLVNVPAPAIRGKTKGIIVVFFDSPSNLKISTPKIISIASTKMMRAPATANDCMSTLNNLSIISPANRNPIIVMSE